MNVAVFGAGYVGSVTAACLADLGHIVYLVEIDSGKLNQLKLGQSPVFEPGLDELLGRYLEQQKIIVTDSTSDAVSASSVALVCVGTPSRADGLSELGYVKKVLEGIGEVLPQCAGSYVVAIRSTIPGNAFTAELEPLFKQYQGDTKSIGLAVNPEFLREGSGIQDFLNPPYVVVGTEDDLSVQTLQELYRPLDTEFLVVSPGTACLLKYACNAFHALKVSFANEIGNLGPVFGANALEVMDLFCRDKNLNVSDKYLRPGFAFGGSCLPKDLRAIQRLSSLSGIEVPVLSSILRSNELIISEALKVVERLEVRKVALIGLSFKDGTDDLRESPYLRIAEQLLGKGYSLKVFDSDVNTGSLIGQNLEYYQSYMAHLGAVKCETVAETLSGVEAVIWGKDLFDHTKLLDYKVSIKAVLDLTRKIEDLSGEIPVVHIHSE